MSRYAETSSGIQEQVASNLGWTEFGRWLESLPPGNTKALRALYDTGESSELSEVARQLGNALRSMPPDEKVHETARLLLEVCQQNADQRLIITT